MLIAATLSPAAKRAILAASVAAAALFAQPAGGPAFEVASVKASPPADRPVYTMRGGPGTNSPGQITYLNVKVRMLVTTAWDLKDYQLTGPATMDAVRFDIVAKVPPDTNRHDFLLMLQRLLTERIGLAVHHEPKEMPVYEMVIAKGGTKMKEAEPAPDGGPAPFTNHYATDPDGFAILPPGRKAALTSGLGGVTRMSARMFDMAAIVELMERHSGRPVIDKSGLAGSYDFKLAFDTSSSRQSTAGMMPAMVAAGLGPLPPGNSPTPQSASDPAPTFMEAIVKQLGLKLEPAKAVIDVLCVDSFNKTPIEN